MSVSFDTNMLVYATAGSPWEKIVPSPLVGEGGGREFDNDVASA